MNRARHIGTFLFLAGLSLLSLNCGGGGGGGAGGRPATEVTEGPAITAAVQGFVQAIGARDQQLARSFLSPKILTPAGAGGPGDILSTLIVWDFGRRIADGADDQAYTFTIPDGAIYQPSSGLAEVTSTFAARNGDHLTVVFELGKESGVWLIEAIRLTVVPGGSYRLAEYFPLVAGNSWEFLRLEPARPAVASYVLRTLVGPPLVLGGSSLFLWTETDQATTLPALRGSTRPQPVPGAGTPGEYWGTEPGLSYYQVPDFIEGNPIALLPGVVEVGDLGAASFTRVIAGSPVTFEYTAEVGVPELFPTPLGGFLALPIIIRTTSRHVADPGLDETRKTILYLARGIGPVGRIEYLPDDEQTIARKDSLVEARVNGRAYDIPNSGPPAVTDVRAAGNSGDISILYNLADPDNQACSLAFEYSLDGGTTWIPSTNLVGGMVNLHPASNLNLRWKSATDFQTDQPAVVVRLTPSDGATGTAGLSPAFAVNNNTATPTVTQLQPANGATAVPRGATLTLTLSKPVTKGATGTVTISRSVGDTLFVSLPIADPRITVVSQTVTIDPLPDFESATTYDVRISGSCFVDASSRPFSGIADPGVWRFTTVDDAAPAVVGLQPTDGSVGVASGANLVLTFDEGVTAGTTGNVVIRRSADNSVFETIPATDTARVAVGGTQVTIDPTGNLESQAGYYVQIAGTCFRDGSGNFYAGLADTTSWNFTAADGSAPVIVTLSPADGSAGVASNANLVLTFGEDVVAGTTGNVVIRRSADDTIFETIPATDTTRVAVAGAQVTINPTGSLESQAGYYVQIAGTCFRDGSGNFYAGLADTTSWNFTAADTTSPVIVTLSPADGFAGVASNANLVLTFDEGVTRGTTGNVVIRRSVDDTIFETIPATDTVRLYLTGTQAFINPTGSLESQAGYYVQIASTCIRDASGNFFSGLADATTWNFTAADSSPPVILTLAPADNAVKVATNGVLLMTFNETMTRGTGNVVLRRSADDTVFETIPVTDLARVGIAGNQVTIDPTGSLDELVGFYVQIAGTCFLDGGGNSFSGIADTTSWSFTVGSTWPFIVDLAPPNTAAGVATMADLAMIFNENVLLGTSGAVNIFRAADDTLLESIPIGDLRITITNQLVTIDPTANLASGTQYYVTVEPYCLQNASGMPFGGITGSDTWTFLAADGDLPDVLTFLPANGGAGVAPTTNLVMTFNENVTKGPGGNVTIVRTGDNFQVETIPILGPNVTVSGTDVTINPAANLAALTEYYVIVDPGSIVDLTGNPFFGILFPFTWGFTTGP